MTDLIFYPLTLLAASIAFIVMLTAKLKFPAFFALFLACLLVGLVIGLPLAGVIATIKDGFGNILKLLDLIIVLGTTRGLLLEFTGSITVIAAFLLKGLGKKLVPLAGSMMASHPNDAYFWVIAKFSGLEMKAMLKVYSVATILMGLTTFRMVYVLSKTSKHAYPDRPKHF